MVDSIVKSLYFIVSLGLILHYILIYPAAKVEVISYPWKIPYIIQ